MRYRLVLSPILLFFANAPFVHFLVMTGVIIFFPESGIILLDHPVPLLIPLICALNLPFLLGGYYSSRHGNRTALIITLLAALMAASCLANMQTPFDPLLRALSIFLSAMSGYFIGTCVLHSERRLRITAWWLAGILAVYLAMCLGNVPYEGTAAYPLALLHKHPQAAFIFFLMLGPLTLAMQGTRRTTLAMLPLLFAPLAVFYYQHSRVGMLLPLAMIPIIMVVTRMRWRWLAAFLALAMAANLFLYSTTTVMNAYRPDHEGSYYRSESPFLAVHILSQSLSNVLVGTGMRTSKLRFMEGYEPVTLEVDMDAYVQSIEKVKSLDILYLSTAVDAGLPFALFYFGVLLAIWLSMVRTSRAHPQDRTLIAATLLISTMLIHFLVYDGLYYPYVSFFFHVLLGLGVARIRLARQADQARTA